MSNSEKIYEKLREVITLAREITKDEGEAIFRSNIFIETMCAVEQGDKYDKRSLAEQLEMKLGLWESKGIDIVTDDKSKIFYVTFNKHSRHYGYYAEVRALSALDAANRFGGMYGWLEWDQVETKKPEGMELVKEDIQPITGQKELNPEILEIFEETFQTIESKASDHLGAEAPLKDKLYDLSRGELTHEVVKPTSALSPASAVARQAFDRDAYLRSHGLRSDGSKIERG